MGTTFDLGRLGLTSGEGRRFSLDVALDDFSFGGERYSQEVAAKIDAEVTRILEEAKERARKVLTDHRKALDSITKVLIEKETIDSEELNTLFAAAAA